MSESTAPETQPVLATEAPTESAPAPIDPKVDASMAAEVEQEAEQQAEEAIYLREPAAPEAPSIPEAAPTSEAVHKPQADPEPVVETVPAVPEESFADIYSEFQRTHQRREGTGQIRGTVVAVTDDSVLVDIGFKLEGILPLTAFPKGPESIKPGDALQVSVKGRDESGYYALSLFRTAVPKDWTGLERAFEQKATIVGTVTGVVKGGLHVDVGVRAFLPASRSGTRDAAEMEKLVGEEIRCRITKLDVADEDVVVDRRVVLEEEALADKDRRYSEVQEGAVLDGTVRTIMDYGAFVDLGGIDGLLHIGDLSWHRVSKVDDVLTVGQKIEVKILKIDPETHRIALGLKQLQAHPWDAVPEKYKTGEKVRGIVSRIADFGAFVEIEPGVEGLVHLSEMSWSKRIHKATEVVKAGDAVEAVILGIDVPARRISLGLKQALGDPWEEASKRLFPGAIVEGPVASIMKFGAFVKVAEGVEGLVHISEIVPDRRLNHPSDAVHVGQQVAAVVLGIDREKRQLKLSIKQAIPTGLDEFLAEHKAGDKVTGRIAAIHDGVAQVEVGEGILATCKLPATAPAPEPAPEAATTGKADLSALSSLLQSKWKTGSSSTASKSAGKTQPAETGQVRNFRISRIDLESKVITLELIA
ncbi:S1 RNA-binding domain-containing protein [Acidicapsa dinghuensis]|uniref:S1 RNA-binding domain-containing protein n=1 Tax=Acidicapsa dinghuensis TaxID=2218256 RepID=A0ABW1EI11_9BACT|nr:S1 RNA-binding domain-containing protein [Acidicapsa dinghuensis]